MKKGLISICIMAGFLLSILMVGGVFAQTKAVIEMTAPNGNVKFTHQKHYGDLKIDCYKCHHAWKKGETSGKACKDCHTDKAEGKKLTLKDAFHQDCYKGCHTEQKKGPTKCGDCHVKAKK